MLRTVTAGISDPSPPRPGATEPQLHGGQARGCRPWLVFLGIALAFSLAFQGSRPLWEPDEGRYAEAAREMLVSGDWLTPQLDFRPHLTKPPLTYWMAAAGLRLFGKSEWGARFFHGIAFALAALLVGLLGEAMGTRREGMLAGLVFLTSLLPFSAGNLLTPDMPLTLLEILGVWGFWRALTAQPPGGVTGPLLMWGGFGAAFLCKGPPGLLPLLAIVAFLSLRRRLPWRSCFPIWGVAVFLGLGFGWFLVVAAKDPGLIRYFLAYELLDRVFTTVHARTLPWYAYELILLAGMLPWSLFLPSLLGEWAGRAGERAGEGRWRRPRRAVAAWSNRRVFLLLWLLAPLLLLTLARSRSYLYVLPLAAPLSLGIAMGLTRGRSWWEAPASVWPRRGVCAALAVWLVALLGVKGVSAHLLLPSRDARVLAEVLGPYVSGQPTEVVLLGMEGRHGLAFYLEQDIEYVELGPEKTNTFMEDTLREELNELPVADIRHIFVGRLRQEEDLRRRLPPTYSKRLRIHRYVVYVYEPVR